MSPKESLNCEFIYKILNIYFFASILSFSFMSGSGSGFVLGIRIRYNKEVSCGLKKKDQPPDWICYTEGFILAGSVII